MNHRPALALVATTMLFAMGPAALATPRGPAFGNNRYRTEIRDARGEADVDDYVASLVAGERLSVTVVAARKSDLLPDVTVLRPDGTVVASRPRLRKGGRSAAHRKLEIDATGPWTVRVAGSDGTQGEYTVSFKVAGAPALRWKKQALGGDDPLERTHAIPAVDGAALDLALRWERGDTPVETRALRDPAGGDVPGASGAAAGDVVVKGAKAVLKGATLVEGDGAYELDVAIPDGRARYSLTAKVRPTGRPAGRRVTQLASDEPFIGARVEPLRGVAGRPVRVTGGSFSTDEPPEVLFGGVAGASVVVSAGGASLDVVPPSGVEGSTVALSVVNPDGQAHTREGHFHYARPPVLTGLVRDDGSAARGGATVGGQEFRVLGSYLHPEQTVLFGAQAAAPSAAAPGDGELRVITPPSAAGAVAVRVVDPYGRSSPSELVFEFKVAPSFDTAPYDPPYGASAEALTVTATGAGFLDSDTLLLDGEALAHTVSTPASIVFDLPPLALGDHDVRVRDRVGTVVVAPVFTVKGPPVVAAATPIDGSYSGTDGVPLTGGALVEVTGSSFHALDTVTLGDDTVDVVERSFAVFRFVSPPGAAGTLDLVVTDVAGQSSSLSGALQRLGYVDATASRSPGGSAVDDLSAWRGVIADLDGDDAADDVVIVSYGLNRGNVTRGNRGPTSGTANTPGTRREMTRVLLGDGNGLLVDGTASRLPAARSDPSGKDDWNGMAVAVGDLDGSNGPEIVVAGVSPDYTTQNDVRIFRSTGSGAFALETADPLPDTYLPAVYAYDETGAPNLVYTARYNQGLPTSLALGDLDSDGDLDVVVGRDWYDLAYAYVDPGHVDFGQTPPYVTSLDAYYYLSYTFYYYTGTKVFVNGLSDATGWSDGSSSLLPSAGDSNVPVAPGLFARDLALGDVDRDGSLDIVLTWDDPLTVSPYGLYGGYDQARVATRVLLNDGTGDFSGASASGTGDVTGTWLPAPSGNELWQAHRLALADLDNDLDLDLVLLHEQSIDAYAGTPTYTRSALRILRNDHVPATGSGGFVDVTATAVPPLPAGSNDNWRGGALTVVDVDGDGYLDLVVGTRDVLRDGAGARVRSTRVLLGGAGLTFRPSDAFLPGVDVDSGEADDLLVGDLAGTGDPVLLRLSEPAPDTSPGDEHLRAADWTR